MAKQVRAADMPAEMATMAQQFDAMQMPQAMDGVGLIVQAGIVGNFAEAVGPDGARWPARVDNLPHPELVDTTALAMAATGQGPGVIKRVVGGNTIQVGVDKSVDLGGIPGAAVHNFGYPKKGIPQREWLYANATVLDDAAELIARDGVTEIFA